MKNKEVDLTGYYAEQQEICLQCLSSYSGNKEQLHRLRVAIKKIKAVFKLTNALHKKFKYKKAFAPYRPVFKAAGPIREEQLLDDKLKGLIKTGKAQQRAAVIKRLNQQFRKQIAGFVAGMGQTSKTEDALGSLSGKKVANYCSALLKKIQKSWLKLKSEKDFHEMRKELKQLQYCVQLLPKKQREEIISSKKLERLDELQDTIGKWHDNVLVLDKLSQNEEVIPDDFVTALKEETRALRDEFLKTGNKLLK